MLVVPAESKAKRRRHLLSRWYPRRLAGGRAAGDNRAMAWQDRSTRRGRWLLLVCMVNHPQAVAAQPFLDALVDWAWARDADAEDCCKR